MIFKSPIKLDSFVLEEISASSSFVNGSFKIKIEITHAIKAITAATKNGTRIPYSAINPPIPGPIMNPVLIAADKYPIAFGRS